MPKRDNHTWKPVLAEGLSSTSVLQI